MKTQTQITQLVFNVINLTWQMCINVRGGDTIINIEAEDAQRLLNSIKHDDTDRINIEYSKDSSLIYYIIN